MPYALKIGNHLIEDILDPKAEQIDVAAIDYRLKRMHRFSNDPAALTVHVHQQLVAQLALFCGEPPDVVYWCLHHDDHEAVTGDIPGPLKSLIGHETNVLHKIEDRLDRAIHAARRIGMDPHYARPFPDVEIRQRVHFYDKAAETVEWRFQLGLPAATWNRPVPERLTHEHAQRLLALSTAICSGEKTA